LKGQYLCVVDVCVQSWGVPAILSGRFMCFFVLVFKNGKVIKNYFWWELWACSFCELDSQDCRPVGGGKCGKRRPSGAQRVGHVFEVWVGVGWWGHPFTEGSELGGGEMHEVQIFF
jgi:hypothetical protein